MSEIVERLRAFVLDSQPRVLLRETADEIERLQAERDDWHKVADARSAEINRLMGELAAAKALLQEAIGYAVVAVHLAPGWMQHPDDVGKNERQIHGRGRDFINRILAALGDSE